MGNTSRLKTPLTVGAQRRLVEKAQDKEKPLIMLILSTGLHPIVLSNKNYGLNLDDPDYFIFRRPKTRKIVQGAWSKMMREKGILEALRRIRGKTTWMYWWMVKQAGKRAGIDELGPLRLRHTHFVNRARLGHDVFSISAATNTNIATVQQYYMIGIGEMQSLTDSDRIWLKELMEP